MLTKEQIVAFWDWHECNCDKVFDLPKVFDVCKQARQAIDLAAENERLKAKLDDLRNLATEETYGTANMSWPKAMQAVLAIIGKDGDDK